MKYIHYNLIYAVNNWKSKHIPSQLAKENKKFLYQVIKDGARVREYEGALTEKNLVKQLVMSICRKTLKILNKV